MLFSSVNACNFYRTEFVLVKNYKKQKEPQKKLNGNGVFSLLVSFLIFLCHLNHCNFLFELKDLLFFAQLYRL